MSAAPSNHPSEQALAAELETRLLAQIGSHFDVAEHNKVKIAATLLTPKGAARQPCGEGWKTSPKLELMQFTRVVVPVTCGDSEGSFVVKFSVQAPVWVLVADRPAGHVLTPEDLQAEVADIKTVTQTTSSNALLGYPLRLSMKAGVRLKTQHVERPVLIHSADAIQIVSSQDGISVSTPGKAMSTGRLGDVIEVRNTRTQWIVRGRVKGPGTIEALSASPPKGISKQQL